MGPDFKTSFQQVQCLKSLTTKTKEEVLLHRTSEFYFPFILFIFLNTGFGGFTDDLIPKSPAFYRMSFSAFKPDAIYFLIAGAKVTTWQVA